MNYRAISIIFLLTVSVTALADAEWHLKSVKENYWVEAPFTMPTSTEVEFSNGHVVITKIIEFDFIEFITPSQAIPSLFFRAEPVPSAT